MSSILETGPTMNLSIGMLDALPNEALNWAVAWTMPTRADPKAVLGSDLRWSPRQCTMFGGNRFNPTEDWRDLGFAIERTDIVLANHFSPPTEATTSDEEQEQRMGLDNYWGGAHCYASGTTHDTWRGVKIATCRAIASAWLVHGRTIPIPLSLLDPTNEQT